jgi:hypothetical protein
MAVPDGIASYAWAAAATVAAPGVFGFGIVRWLGLQPAHGLRFALASGYVVGHYALAHATLAWLALRKPFPGFLLPIAALFGGLWLLHASWRRPAPPAKHPPTPWWSWLPVALLALVALEAFTATNAEPVYRGDEALIWAAKAKVLYGAPGFDLGLGLALLVQHADYPLLDPLAQALAFASSGRVLQYENRLPIQCFAIALLLVLSSALARRARPLVATLVLVAFAGSAFAWQATTADADTMLACCTLLAAEALLRWRENGDRACFAIACIAGGAMLASKNEGTLLVAALAVPFAVDAALRTRRGDRRRVLPLAAWLAVPLAAFTLHRAFNLAWGLQNDLTDPALAGDRGLATRMVEQFPTHAGQVARFYGELLVDSAQHRLLPLLFLVAAPFAWLLGRSAPAAGVLATLLATFVLAMLGFMAVFVGTPADLTWHLATAAARTLSQVVPIAALGLAVAIAPARTTAER